METRERDAQRNERALSPTPYTIQALTHFRARPRFPANGSTSLANIDGGQGVSFNAQLALCTKQI